MCGECEMAEVAAVINSAESWGGGVCSCRHGGAGGTERAAKTKTSESSIITAIEPLLILYCQHVQEAFGSRSRFWSEHGYNSETGTPGYFSYIHVLGKQPTTSIEQVRAKNSRAHLCF